MNFDPGSLVGYTVVVVVVIVVFWIAEELGEARSQNLLNPTDHHRCCCWKRNFQVEVTMFDFLSLKKE